MNSDVVIISLLVFIAVREVFHAFQMHRLLNKAMSGSYYQYKVAESVGKPAPETAADEIPIEDFMAEVSSMDGLIPKY